MAAAPARKREAAGGLAPRQASRGNGGSKPPLKREPTLSHDAGGPTRQGKAKKSCSMGQGGL